MRDFSCVKKVVIKLGTNVLTKNNAIDYEYIENIAGQVAAAKKKGIKVMLVSSGAIGIGANELGIEKKINKVRLRQACAAVGQPILLNRYKLAFSQYNISIGQVLVTRENINNRDTYVNLQNAVSQLLELGVVPIFNENDCVSVREIEMDFGDNDQLSAHVASKTDMDLLIILSDINGLYDKNPGVHSDAKLIPLVDDLTDEIIGAAGDAGSAHSTGGMKTKLKAVSIAQKAGCKTVLAHGRDERVITRILEGEELGTLFKSKARMKNRARWILNAIPKGKIIVDEGAINALRKRKSLLPSGIVEVQGDFDAGEVVLINDEFKAVVNLGSSKMRKIIGLHSKEISEILGPVKRDGIARSSDIIPLEK